MDATRLQALTAGRSFVCQEKDRDRFGRIVAICRVSERIWAPLWSARDSPGRLPSSASIMSISRKRPALPTGAYTRTIACQHGSGERNRGAHDGR
jgi:hypothetical protein